MNITVSKQEILTEVERRISLESSILPEKYDLLWLSANKKELVDGFWIEGCESIVTLFRKYIVERTTDHTLDTYNSGDIFSFSVMMPWRYNSNFDSSINNEVKMMLACNIIYRWFSAILPDVSEKYKIEANGYIENITKKINLRTPNDSSMFTPEIDDVKINKSQDYSYSAKTDDIEIVQMWEKECRVKL